MRRRAALPLTSITAWELLFDRLNVPENGGPGQSLLVIKATLGKHFGSINASNLRSAHALIESGKAEGKIVVESF